MKPYALPLCILATSISLFSAAAAHACPGDCNGDREVVVSELVTGVGIALGNMPVGACPAADRNGSGDVSVDELVAAVSSALGGCPPDTATASPTVTPTPSPSPTVNLPPSIPPHGVYLTYPGQTVALSIGASDPLGDVLTYAATDLPAGAELGAESGVLTWMPQADQTGPFYVSVTATDPESHSASAQLALQVNPPDSCVDAQCDPATGCQVPLKPLGENCCSMADPPRVAQATATCPLGRVVNAGRNYPRGGFGRIANCNLVRLRDGIQTGPVVVLNFEMRCLNPFSLGFDVKLQTAGAVVFNEFHSIRSSDLLFRDDGFAELRGEPFAVNRTLPRESLEGAEADLTVTVTDSENTSVTTKLRVLLTFEPTEDLEDL